MVNPIAAVVQMTSTADVEANLARAAALCARARARGADLCALPENFALLSSAESDKLAVAEEIAGPGAPERPGLILSRMGEVARREGLHLFLGGMPERGPDPGRVFNSCVHLL